MGVPELDELDEGIYVSITSLSGERSWPESSISHTGTHVRCGSSRIALPVRPNHKPYMDYIGESIIRYGDCTRPPEWTSAKRWEFLHSSMDTADIANADKVSAKTLDSGCIYHIRRRPPTHMLRVVLETLYYPAPMNAQLS